MSRQSPHGERNRYLLFQMEVFKLLPCSYKPSPSKQYIQKRDPPKDGDGSKFWCKLPIWSRCKLIHHNYSKKRNLSGAAAPQTTQRPMFFEIAVVGFHKVFAVESDSGHRKNGLLIACKL